MIRIVVRLRIFAGRTAHEKLRMFAPLFHGSFGLPGGAAGRAAALPVPGGPVGGGACA